MVISPSTTESCVADLVRYARDMAAVLGDVTPAELLTRAAGVATPLAYADVEKRTEVWR